MYDIKNAETSVLPEIMEKLPHPTGYRMLVAIPQVSEKTDGGIIKPDLLKARESEAAVLGLVIRMGPECYADKAKFSEPWCKVGDWVLIRSYAGTKVAVSVSDANYRIINDDTVEAVIPDPMVYRRAC